MLFFSPFGPFDDQLIPYHPIGWAGIFIYFAMILSFKQKFKVTKDLFWFVVALGFFPLFISDLYFFPIPRLLGFGMLEWAGTQFVVFFVSFALSSRVRVLRYTNLVMLILLPVAIVVWFSPDQNGLLNAFRLVPLLFLFVTTLSLSYYSLQQRDYLFIVGTVLNFMIANVISTLYATTGSLAFGWSQLFMAVVTDRVAIFGRILMALNLSPRIKRGQKDASK
jgi:hypothetical protein